MENSEFQLLDPQSQTLLSLDSLTALRVRGEDAESFLQGQFSNDVAALKQGEMQLNVYCNPKGRALALIRLARLDQEYTLVLPAAVAAKLLPRLKMFVLRAKVTIEADAGFRLAGIVGTNTLSARHPDVHAIDVPGEVPRTLLLGESKHMEDLLAPATLDTPGNDDLWRWVDILSGIPQVYAQTMETFIPQTVNLDLVGGISFRKGCYPGQEIVARVRYLGKVKQRMLPATVEDAGPLAPGDGIFRPDRPQQKSGQIVDAVRSGPRQYTLSAMVPADMLTEGELRVGSADGAVLQRLPLPYPVPD